MISDRIEVLCPATTANFGPGFDVFGMALTEPRDVMRIRVEEYDFPAIEIEVSGRYADIPRDPKRNVAGYVAEKIMRDFDLNYRISIEIEKNIPISSGLGSSAASSAGIAFALNEIFELGLDKSKLVEYASIGEELVAGAPHLDNVAPAIYGGFTIVRKLPTDDKPLVIRIDPPELDLVIALPKIRLETKVARAVLPKQIPLHCLTQNVAAASSLVAGMLRGDKELIGSSMFDSVVEPARAHLIPNYWRVKERALERGALGVTISGAGPAVIALVEDELSAEVVGSIMREEFSKAGVECEIFFSKPGDGVRIHRD